MAASPRLSALQKGKRTTSIFSADSTWKCRRDNVKPRFPFGFGLSYSTFKFSNLSVTPADTSAMAPLLLDARAFAFYDAAGKHWQADAGTFAMLVGDSSAEMPLSATVTLPKAISIGMQE
jgi:hypothetical protein